MKSIYSVGGEIGTVSVFDGPYLFFATGNSISIITMDTPISPTLLATLPPPISGMQPIISLALHPTTKGAIFGATKDGMIFLWDWINQTLLERWKLCVPSLLSLLPSKDSNNIFIVTQKTSSGKPIATIFKLPLSDLGDKDPFKRILEAPLPNFPLPTEELLQNFNYSPFALGKGDLLAYLCLDRKLGSCIAFKYLLSPSTSDKLPERIIIGSSPASVPTILLFSDDAKNLFYSNKRGQIFSLQTGKKVLHWHSRSPHSLVSHGDSLFSGGEEGCLLRWNFNKTNSNNEDGRPDFLPHIQSPIVNLSKCPSKNRIALLLESGSILFVDGGTMKIEERYSCPSSSSSSSKNILLSHPKIRNIVWTNGRKGKIESLSLPHHKNSFKSFDVTEENVISRGRSLKCPKSSNIDAIASSSDGRYVASSTSLGHNNTLKIWREGSGGGGGTDWECMVAFEDCHSVKEIIFSPLTKPNYSFISIGSQDRKVSLWSSKGKRVASIQKNSKDASIEIRDRIAWIQEQSFTFQKKDCLCATFSKDGNQLLIAYEGGLIRIHDLFVDVKGGEFVDVKKIEIRLSKEKKEEITSTSFLNNNLLLITTGEKIILKGITGTMEKVIQCPLQIIKGIPCNEKEFIITTKVGLILWMSEDLTLIKSFKHDFRIENSIISKNGNLIIRDVKGCLHWIMDEREDDSIIMSSLKEDISLKIKELQRDHQSPAIDIRPQEIINPIKVKISPDHLKMQQKALLSTISNYLLPLPSESISYFLKGL